jgi:Phosphatidylinositol-4-phosphate 5-Kinase
MLFIDRVVAVIALAQAAMTMVRAGSRALHIQKSNSIGVMEGPLILPEVIDKDNRRNVSPLWELATCLEHAVLLAARPELYENAKHVETSLIQLEPETPKTPYSMSSFAVPTNPRENQEDELLDEEIERILNETDTIEESSRKTTLVGRIVQRIPSVPVPFFTSRRAFSNKEEDDYLSSFPDIDVDFTVSLTARIVLDPGNATENRAASTAHVSAIAPSSFEKLRSYFGVSEVSYLQSLLHSGPFVSFQSNSKGAARVGGVFFFTRDGAYMIKTIKRDEVPTFLHMLPKYHRYMKTMGNGRRSLLTRFCGMYEVQINTGSEQGKRQIILVMNSVFPAEGSKFISERFDLKGSILGRECSAKERQSKGPLAVLKDLDLSKEVELVRSLKHTGRIYIKEGLHVGPTAKAAMFTQLRKDVKFLIDCQVIDYSLLVGVVKTKPFYATLGDRFLLAKSQGELLRTKLVLRGKSRADSILASLIAPIKLFLAPPIYVANSVITKLSNAMAWSLPYYGAEQCGVDAGHLTQAYGERHGQPALYYFGLIDFLQPWNAMKMAEYKWKSLRYGQGFSCVPPEEYADRFLRFVEQHIT